MADCRRWGTQVDSPIIPCVLVGMLSFVVTHCFMDVYDTSIQTLMLSFCLDEYKVRVAAASHSVL